MNEVETIQEVLRMHKAWLDDLPQGETANLSEAWLAPNISLEGAKLNRAILKGMTYIWGNLSSTDLSYTDLSYADLAKADLRHANLSSATLKGTHLEGANLKRVDLRGTDLSYADLRGADLRGANLRGACLCHTNLAGANLEGAYVINTDLYDADLRGATFPWLIEASSMGSGHNKMLYMANLNAVFCRGFENCKGRSLADFQAMVEEIYPVNHTGRNFILHMEYMSAIKMFEGMRGAYLEYRARWKR